MTRTAFVLNRCGAIAVTTAVVVAHGTSGSNRSSAPPALRMPPGGVFKMLLTVGDIVNGYRLAGGLDGLAAFDNGYGTFTLLVHHERAASTEPRHTRESGTCVSRWLISADDFTVLDGANERQPFRQDYPGQVDASEFLGEGWHLRIDASRILAVQVTPRTMFQSAYATGEPFPVWCLPIVASSSCKP